MSEESKVRETLKRSPKKAPPRKDIRRDHPVLFEDEDLDTTKEETKRVNTTGPRAEPALKSYEKTSSASAKPCPKCSGKTRYDDGADAYACTKCSWKGQNGPYEGSMYVMPLMDRPDYGSRSSFLHVHIGGTSRKAFLKALIK